MRSNHRLFALGDYAGLASAGRLMDQPAGQNYVQPNALARQTPPLFQTFESLARYVLLLKWETLENHTVDFRGTTLFAEWRALVGEFFAAPPSLGHFEVVR
jgi:hypothetical protein